MKLKHELNKLRELPFIVQILYGFILIQGIVSMLILKVIFMIFYFLFKKLEAFNKKKLRPFFSSLNEYIYVQACGVFDCEIEASSSALLNEKIEQTMPVFLRLKKVFARISSFLFGKNKALKIGLTKKKSFRNSKIVKSESRGWLDVYITKFQTLFRLVQY